VERLNVADQEEHDAIIRFATKNKISYDAAYFALKKAAAKEALKLYGKKADKSAEAKELRQTVKRYLKTLDALEQSSRLNHPNRF
jgi:hypothetical protein